MPLKANGYGSTSKHRQERGWDSADLTNRNRASNERERASMLQNDDFDRELEEAWDTYGPGAPGENAPGENGHVGPRRSQQQELDREHEYGRTYGTYGRGHTHRRSSSSQQYTFDRDDFYIRMVEAFRAWSKTRRKFFLRATGRLLVTILLEVLKSAWIVKFQLAFMIATFVVSLIFTIHIYHHSHWKPYPWRIQCAQQPQFFTEIDEGGLMQKYRTTEPAGIFLGVMSMASETAYDRRMKIRESWAAHWASRGRWEEGKIWTQDEMDKILKSPSPPSQTELMAAMNSTSRVVVRFVMGRPVDEWKEKIIKENELYNDIIVLPMRENMNDGKSFAFIDWSFEHALVPPAPYSNATSKPTTLSKREPVWVPDHAQEEGREKRHREDAGTESGNGNDQAHPHGGAAIIDASGRRPPAPHDPLSVHGKPFSDMSEWVRPDYVVKTDDDSFVMLTELEARLRVLPRKGVYWGYPVHASSVDFHAGEAYGLSWDLVEHVSTYARQHQPRIFSSNATDSDARSGRAPMGLSENFTPPPVETLDDHGHGPLYQNLALAISGREDQVTAHWMTDHKEDWNVTWYDERCWVYDHPKAGTVYSKGFLFPLEIQNILEEWKKWRPRAYTSLFSSSGSLARNPTLDDTQLNDHKNEETHITVNGREGPLEQDSTRPEYKRLKDPTYSTVLRQFWRASYPFAVKWPNMYKSPFKETLYQSDQGNDGNQEKPLSPEELKVRKEIEMDGLIEGSRVSMVMPTDTREEIVKRWKMDVEVGWRGRYLLDANTKGVDHLRDLRIPIGGTIVVHYVKLDEHWKECEDVLLEGWRREQEAKSPFINAR